MNEAAIARYITDTFDGIETVTAMGTTFFFDGPEHMIPLVTIVTSDDAYDAFSKLDRPGVYRLNIGITKPTFESLFGAQPAAPGAGTEHTYDFTALDQLLPHPVYGRQHWVCVLNPSAATFDQVVRPLLDEAYALAARKRARRAARG